MTYYEDKIYLYAYDLNYDIARQISVVKRSTRNNTHSINKLNHLQSLMTPEKESEYRYQNHLLRCQVQSLSYDELLKLKNNIIDMLKTSDGLNIESYPYRNLLTRRLKKLEKTINIKKPKEQKDKKKKSKDVRGSIYDTGSYWSYKKENEGLKAYKF